MNVITRFAPSPTGFLHIGSARTALFNYLFSRHHHGKFLLRVEDTDRARSTEEAITAILDGLKWLGLDFDGEVVYQFALAARHAEVAHHLVQCGKAYYCYTAAEELSVNRDAARKEGKPYISPWREYTGLSPAGIKPVVRIKAPLEGVTITHDLVQGEVVVNNSQLDDMVLLRSDGTPTYMLAVVVDDHDMNITHIIRGDDHLNNAARQAQIYKAMGWDIPKFAHIPLIHGPDGAKLSKRHGALGIDEYRKMGYLEEALRNYLLRLGWSHGNDELISSAQAIEWFNLESVGKAPSRIDFKKMENLNSHYIKSAENDRLLKLVVPFIEQNLNSQISEQSLLYIKAGMDGLKTRAKTILELAKLAEFYVQMLEFTPEAKVELQKMDKKLVSALLAELQSLEIWDEDGIKQVMHHLAEVHNVKIGEIAQILRIALTYSTISPSVNEIMLVLGKEESLQRLEQLL